MFFFKFWIQFVYHTCTQQNDRELNKFDKYTLRWVIMYFLLKMWAFVVPLWVYVLVGFCPRGFCPRGFCPRGFCPTLQNTAYCTKFPYMWHQRVAIVVMNRAHRQFLHAGCRHNAFLMDSNNIFLPDQHSRDVSSCRAAGDFSSCELDYTMYVLSFARSENYVNHKYRVIWVLFTRWREIIRPLPSVNPSFFSQYHTYYYISISISTYIYFSLSIRLMNKDYHRHSNSKCS